MKKTMWLLACFGLFYTYGCRKPADDPAVFRNSFSCKINGVDWKPEGGSNATGGANLPNITVTKFAFMNSISIGVLKQVRDPNNMSIDLKYESFRLRFDLEVKEQVLHPEINYFYDHLGGCTRSYPDSTAVNKIVVTELDTINKTIGGRFFFVLKDELCNKKLSVTDGNFKLKY